LFQPFESADQWLTNLFVGSPFLVALGIAFLLGLRHASDPDHLVAVTSLVASDGSDTRAAARLGTWWGLGHATILIPVLGLSGVLFGLWYAGIG
jgi:high-affinity nickel permease